ncbi:MAG TPA: hypothetical protein VFE36_11365, partial [Candidatus Baltobacteraceae bacterium]|nr:hypothetical protein [Candidatus Baltobacteraceae bacterium]
MDQAVAGRILSGKGRLVVLSFLMLFVELALIRWTGSNVVYLSYFSNFVLLGSFLGIGIGFLRAQSKPDLFPWAAVLLSCFVLFVLRFPVTIDRSGSADVIFFGAIGTRGLPIWFALPVVFLSVAAIMSAIAQGVAQTFVQFEPLEAYRLDIAGSLAGICAFSLLSLSGAPPVAWGVIVAIAFLTLYARSSTPLQVVATLVLIAALGTESLVSYYSWSPYYKIGIFPYRHGVFAIVVNGIPHQLIQSVSSDGPDSAFYFDPYRMTSAKHV